MPENRHTIWTSFWGEGHENVDGDEYPDLVVQFQDSDYWVAGGDGTATLTGQLSDGTPIEGSDSIYIVP
jgi:hypothetical protein